MENTRSLFFWKNGFENPTQDPRDHPKPLPTYIVAHLFESPCRKPQEQSSRCSDAPSIRREEHTVRDTGRTVEGGRSLCGRQNDAPQTFLLAWHGMMVRLISAVVFIDLSNVVVKPWSTSGCCKLQLFGWLLACSSVLFASIANRFVRAIHPAPAAATKYL